MISQLYMRLCCAVLEAGTAGPLSGLAWHIKWMRTAWGLRVPLDVALFGGTVQVLRWFAKTNSRQTRLQGGSLIVLARNT
jgi:hypothetical protein